MSTPTELSRDLRRCTDPDLRRRRWLVGLSLFGVAIGQIVTLYQTGILRRLPDPPVGPFDSERVNASDYAYKRLQLPDAVLMVATYAVTAALAAAGGRNRAEEQPLLPVALAAKTLFDVGTNLKLAQEEWADNKAFCAYCQTASLVSIASLALALPEASRGLRNLLGR
jgi:uncharacterized membrane protein